MPSGPSPRSPPLPCSVRAAAPSRRRPSSPGRSRTISWSPRTFAQNQPQNVQALVNTWFDTLQWIKDNRAAATTIMAKRAGVSEADYQTYDTGTTIFTRQQNIEAFTPGTTSANLNFQANSIADFLVSSGLADSKPPLDGLFDGRFVNAAPG